MKLKDKQKLLFWIMVALTIAFIICSITLTTIGIDEFNSEVARIIKISKAEDRKFNSTLFTYSIFCWLMSLLLVVFAGLYGNSIFNKKYQKH